MLATSRQYLRVFRYFTLSSMTITEVLKGMYLSSNYKGAAEFEKFINDCEVLPLDVDGGILAASILAELIRGGQPIGLLDPFIAAVAIQYGRPLVTNNTKHYQRIVDLGFPLELANWREA